MKIPIFKTSSEIMHDYAILHGHDVVQNQKILAPLEPIKLILVKEQYLRYEIEKHNLPIIHINSALGHFGLCSR
jgi:hypothetical protein